MVRRGANSKHTQKGTNDWRANNRGGVLPGYSSQTRTYERIGGAVEQFTNAAAFFRSKGGENWVIEKYGRACIPWEATGARVCWTFGGEQVFSIIPMHLAGN